jgi:hypothetical protein
MNETQINIEKSLLLWAKRVLAALGEVPQLGQFSIESTHSPYEFWAYTNKGEGLVHLKASDRGTGKAYSPEEICSFALPAWTINSIPVESLTEERQVTIGSFMNAQMFDRLSHKNPDDEIGLEDMSQTQRRQS